MLQTIAIWVLLMALPTGAGQGGEGASGNNEGAFLSAVVGATAGRVIRSVAAQLTGACPSFCVENELYAVSNFLFLFALTTFSFSSVFLYIFNWIVVPLNFRNLLT